MGKYILGKHEVSLNFFLEAMDFPPLENSDHAAVTISKFPTGCPISLHSL